MSMCKNPQETIAYKFVPSAPHASLILLTWFVRWRQSGSNKTINTKQNATILSRNLIQLIKAINFHLLIITLVMINEMYEFKIF